VTIGKNGELIEG